MATQTKTPRKKGVAEKKPKATRKAAAKQTERHTPRGFLALIVAAVVSVCAGLFLLARRFSNRAAAAS